MIFGPWIAAFALGAMASIAGEQAAQVESQPPEPPPETDDAGASV